jgi:hypothetical protein
VKEWNLDRFIGRFVWNPLKSTGKMLRFITFKTLPYTIPLYAGGLWLVSGGSRMPASFRQALPVVCAVFALAFVLRSFTERRNVLLSLLLIVLNHFWIALAVLFNERFASTHAYLYLGGVAAGGLLGIVCIFRLRKSERELDLYTHHGHVYEYPRLALLFFIGCLALAGFPVTTTFIGEDLIFSHIHQDQYVLAFVTSLCLIVDGLALVRIYARVFLGPHIKTYHEKALRST